MDFLLFLQDARLQAPDAASLALYYLSEVMGSLFPVIVGVILFWCINKKSGYLIMSCYIACTAINQIVKNIACVYRPWILDARIEPYEPALSGATGYSFPSGHTALTVGFFGSIALWFKKKKWVVAACIVVIALVGFSRMWLGCHTPADVVCSMVLALVTMLVTQWVLKKVDENENYDLIASAVFFVASIVFTVFCALKAYPVDYDALGNIIVDPDEMIVDCYRAFGTLFGISIAWPIERHFIKFSIDGTITTRIVRGIVGLVLIGVTIAFGKLVVPLVVGAEFGRFIEYALLVIVAVVVYPLLFTWFENRRKAPVQD